MENTTYLIFRDEKVTTENGAKYNYVQPVHKMQGTLDEIKKYIKENLPNDDYILMPISDLKDKEGPPYGIIHLKDNKDLSDAEKQAIKEIGDIFEPLKDLFKITISPMPKDKE